MKFYDQLSADYDAFIDWDARMKREDPFFQHIFRECLATSILDLGCGTGGHSLFWGDMGMNMVGVDSAAGMIKIAEQRAEEKELDIEFQCLPITDFSKRIQQQFDSIVCVGNTISHLLTEEDVLKCFRETAASLKPSGAAIIHCLNYQRILDVKKRDMPVKSRTIDGKEYVFCRFYEFGTPNLTFHFVIAVKEDGAWRSHSHQLLHHPWRRNELVRLAKQAGFTQIMQYGGYDFSEFVDTESNDLILVCETGETEYPEGEYK